MIDNYVFILNLSDHGIVFDSQIIGVRFNGNRDLLYGHKPSTALVKDGLQSLSVLQHFRLETWF